MSNSSQIPTGDVDELPKASFWEKTGILSHREGFWLVTAELNSAATFQSRFSAGDDDVLLASSIKTCTTWLMALSHCILKNNDLKQQGDALATDNPHFHVPTVEFAHRNTKPRQFDIYDASAPRLLHTHLPYFALPASVKSSTCNIVYIARSPKDTVISMWHFFNKVFRTNEEPLPLEKVVDCFCSGVHPFGPFSDHVAEYWAESRRRPEKILFVKYEEMRSDPKREVSRIAVFLGRPFAAQGEVEEVLWRCSLERLKNLEVNRSGATSVVVPNAAYFRKGEVGDWKNYLTSEMEDRIHQTVGLKLEALGLFL